MTNKLFFTPGPSQLYFTVEEHIKQAMREQVMEINHRSKQAAKYFQIATENLKTLMGIPEGYHVFFLSAATEIWERLIQNCIIQKSFHLTYGAFSERFYDFAGKWGIQAEKAKGALGDIPDLATMKIPNGTELVSIALNETSTGVSFPMEAIKAIRESNPQPLLAVDGVSAFPAIDFDFTQVDTAYFSVQKCFGLPAGLGIWIVNDRCIEKSKKKRAAGYPIGAYQALPNLLKNAKKHHPTYTFNVLDVFLLGKVSEDMLEKGIDVIRKETAYKSAVLQHMVAEHPKLNHFVTDTKLRSKTVTVANTSVPSENWTKQLSEKGLVIGTGYGALKDGQIRVASFPTHSKEQIELLADTVASMNI